ncbi:MAG: PKD domain-containing protein, partial [Deltaproteobacteria bacterium]|nr:PKD domain-containing protein [Deltaproteobacteria bacterium]
MSRGARVGRPRRAAPPGLVLALAAVLAGCPSEPPADDDDATTPLITNPEAVIAGDDLRITVGEGIAFDGSQSLDAVSYRWDFGDGTGSEPSADSSAIHVYDAPGHYLVALEVLAEDGRPDVATARITVHWERADQKVTRANLLDLDWDEDAILVVATDYDAVANYRPADGAISAWYDTCAGPTTLSHSVSLGNPNALFIACPSDDAVDVWDTASQTPLGRVDLPRGSHPYSVVAPTEGTSGWVALQATGQVAEIIAPLNGTPTLGRILDVLPDPRGLALVDDVLYVSRHRSPDEAGQFAVVDLDTDTVAVHELGLHPGPDSDTTSRGVPSYLQQIGIAPDGRSAAFPSLQANVERGLFREGQALTHETTLRAVLSSVALTEGEASFSQTGGVFGERDRALLDDRGLAVSVSYSPDSDWT